MKPFNVFKATGQFVWLKVVLGVAELLLALLALWVFVKLGNAIAETRGMIIAFTAWLAVCRAGSSLISHLIGYLIKAGHVAVVAEICSTGRMPEKPVAFGFRKVKSRFAASGVYFLVDKLVSGAVSQVQSAVGKIGSLLDFVPGMGQITSIAQKFIGIFLNYIDECCLGWCFLHEEESAFKASCDGVVIYFQNVKHMLKSAAVTTVTVIVATAISGGIMLVLTTAMKMSGTVYTVIAFMIALMLTRIIKTALIDSWMMVKMMCSYMEVAAETEITYDLYEKLCGLSSSFRKLFKKAQKDVPEAMA